MAFISGEELRALQQENAYLKEEVRTWEAMGPHLHLAEELQTELIRQLGSEAIAGMSAPEIGESAYETVKQRKLAMARDELVATYEQTHRRALYERLVEDVRATEGDALMEAAFEEIETNPKLAKELRDSAIKELTARAKDVVSGHVTEQQRAVIEAETDRQLGLDRYDVRFVMEGTVNLTDPKLAETLRPHDRLVVMFAKHQQGQSGVIFKWAEDINHARGWVYEQSVIETPRRSNDYSYNRNDTGRSVTLNTQKIPRDRFVTLGTELPDLANGTTGVKRDVLCAKSPLVVSWNDAEGSQQDVVLKETVRKNRYEESVTTAVSICGTDFQTRNIEFIAAPKVVRPAR